MSRRLGSTAIVLLCVAGAGAAQPPLSPVPARAEEIETSLFLVGDAGHADRPDHPVLLALRDAAAVNSSRSYILFLGDNVYPDGLPEVGSPGRAAAEVRLNTQIDAARASGATTIFVPGNHDWAMQRSEGWDQVRREGRYVVERGGPNVRFMPEDGCPGPATVDVGRSVRLVLLDTQWWLHQWDKPLHPNSSCAADSEDEVREGLREAIHGASGRHVFVAAHHPLASGGPHGGHFPLTDHVFPLRDLKKWLWVPLPVIGSIYPLARRNGISEQDLSNRINRHMVDSLESVFREVAPLAFVAGHDHGLQVLSGQGARHLLVSGAGSYDHNNPVKKLKITRFASDKPGFMRVDVLRDGRVRLGVLQVDDKGDTGEVFAMWLA